ncbi:MAG: hypothetical protein SFX73_01205 [Kofleriaceae bacterium]|nr:hypothetical protein [Kofleriaceae bacterium]
MRRALVLAVVLGCGDKPAPVEPDATHTPDAPDIDSRVLPVFRHPVTTPDAELAVQALEVLERCNGCHGVTKQKLRYWRALSDTALSACFTDLSVSSAQSALGMLDCMRAMPGTSTSDFSTKKLGVFATAARLPWFDYTFWMAYGDASPAELASFQDHVAMPKEGIPALTQAEFDLVAEWFVRGLPRLDQTLVTDPPPSTCENGISSEVATHVAAMATQGWSVVNRTNQMAMFGCGTATDPRDCLQELQLASSRPFGVGWDVPDMGHLRVLREATYATAYWTRSSPDGRFVGHGVANVQGSYVVDLQRDAVIPIAADYDPAFFPDNSGFVFQGGTRNTCPISVLTSNPASVSMNEPGCRQISRIGLYQHLGQMLGGGDYFALDNQFESDDGGKQPTLKDPDAPFGSMAYSSFTPLIFDGTTYQSKQSITIQTPFEGDTVLSHSSRLTLARVSGPDDRQLGYVLRKVIATPQGTNYAITAPEIARYCISGGKPGFSFDERYVAFHHYITGADAVDLGFTGASDPAFAPYLSQGAANIYLLELATGTVHRITNMQPGQYALFPHFRSDGWLYAQVRDAVAEHEYTVASDAALVLP